MKHEVPVRGQYWYWFVCFQDIQHITDKKFTSLRLHFYTNIPKGSGLIQSERQKTQE
jgi:hypothetical protein